LAPDWARNCVPWIKSHRRLCAMKSTSDSPAFEVFDWQALGPEPVIGVDEVGRGCLAGPVYAAAAIVPRDQVAALLQMGVTDSKLLSSTKREKLAIEIRARCHVALGFATAEEIDEINILQASFLAMRRALIGLDDQWVSAGIGARFGPTTAHFLVDGHMKIPMLRSPVACSHWSDVPQTTLIKGDLRALPIAAASIVAKVTRDQWMTEAALEYPGYGFEKHKGYAAPIHRKAIEEQGPTRIHRKTFGGVREFLGR